MRNLETVDYWWHSIDLGNGIVTEGEKSPAVLEAELRAIRLPDLRGKSVLDIGAWDGFFSFEAEKRDAKRVVALDHYSWSTDLGAQQRYRKAHIEGKVVAAPYHEVEGLWRPDSLPGKKGFDVAHQALGSKVESMVVDFHEGDLSSVGAFDVTLYLGVLYHVRDPLGAMTRVASVTSGVAIVESEAVLVRGFEGQALAQFYKGAELNDDPTNWWVPNSRGLQDMCLAAGFSRTELVAGAPPGIGSQDDSAPHYRAVVHAFK